MFFNYFPRMLYPFDPKKEVVTDIFRRVVPRDKFIVNEMFLDRYTLRSGERPEDIAYQLYKDPEYHWVILLINNIIDPYNEWYFTPEQLQAMVKQRYGAGNENEIHHYALAARPLICSDYNPTQIASGELIPITHLEHEELENEARQEILLLRPVHLNDFVQEFKLLVAA